VRLDLHDRRLDSGGIDDLSGAFGDLSSSNETESVYSRYKRKDSDDRGPLLQFHMPGGRSLAAATSVGGVAVLAGVAMQKRRRRRLFQNAAGAVKLAPMLGLCIAFRAALFDHMRAEVAALLHGAGGDGKALAFELS
jgi:hypothetical protein